MIWLALLAAYETGTLVFWRRVLFPYDRISVTFWVTALLLSWFLTPIAAMTMLVVYIAERH